MTYNELELNTEIRLIEKTDGERTPRRTEKCIVVAKYPSMCIVEDKNGRRRGVAVGELIVNNVITQEPELEALRKEGSRMSRGWHKKDTQSDIEYAP